MRKVIFEHQLRLIREASQRHEQTKAILDDKGYYVQLSFFNEEHFTQYFSNSKFLYGSFNEYIMIYRRAQDMTLVKIREFADTPDGFCQCPTLGLTHRIRGRLQSLDVAHQVNEASKALHNWVLALPKINM
jgi:hypothetical protein